jgi:undecaprenyl-diphosphatase
MHYGEGWILVILAIMAADWRHGLRVAVQVLPVLWLTLITVNLPLKRFFGAAAPSSHSPSRRASSDRGRRTSLPSGTRLPDSQAPFSSRATPPLAAPVFYAVAAIVGLSRVYLGVHYPSDVVIGAAAGTILAALYRWACSSCSPSLTERVAPSCTTLDL